MVGREISSEAHEIVRSKSLFAPNLCCTRLTCYGKVLRISQFSRSSVFAHHTFKADLDIAQYLWLAHPFAEHYGGVFLYHFISAAHLSDKARSNEFSSICHPIVEGEGRNGRNLGFISDAHPRQCSAVPAVWVISAIADARFFVSWDGDVEIFHDADALQSRHKLVGVARISVVNERTYPHIRRFLDDFRHGEHPISTFSPVGVTHLASVHLANTISGVAGGVHVDFTIVHRHHK